MNNQQKTFFLMLSIIIPFLIYCFYYYSIMVRNAPYRLSDFVGVTFNYGSNNLLLNRYNSLTSKGQVILKNGFIKKYHKALSNKQLQNLHRKAAELGLWNFPDTLYGIANANHRNIGYYELIFRYKTKTKHVFFKPGLSNNKKIKEAAEALIAVIFKTIDTNAYSSSIFINK